jgi:bifunctional DNA-binding transcriptional regulator/antitoxin component of YhaV-PrlF toxin-antitoxin module
MSKTVMMDRAGRVVVPRATRERFGLMGAAHRLEIVEASDGIVLRPTGVDVAVTRDASGWIVFHSDEAGAVDLLDPVTLVDAERSSREHQVAGE